MTTGQVDIIKTTDRDGNVLTVEGRLTVHAGLEYAAEYVRTAHTVKVNRVQVLATWDLEHKNVMWVRVHRDATAEPADIVRGVEAALEKAWEWCLSLVHLENQLKTIARYHANLAGPSEQLLARIDRIEADVLEAKSLAAASAQELTLRASDVEERQF